MMLAGNIVGTMMMMMEMKTREFSRPARVSQCSKKRKQSCWFFLGEAKGEE